MRFVLQDKKMKRWPVSRRLSGNGKKIPQLCEVRKELLVIISNTYADLLPDIHDPDLLHKIATNDFKLGGLCHHLGQKEEARQAFARALAGFERAMAIDPIHEKSLFGKFHSLNSHMRYEEACAALDELLVLFPENRDYLVV